MKSSFLIILFTKFVVVHTRYRYNVPTSFQNRNIPLSVYCPFFHKKTVRLDTSWCMVKSSVTARSRELTGYWLTRDRGKASGVPNAKSMNFTSRNKRRNYRESKGDYDLRENFYRQQWTKKCFSNTYCIGESSVLYRIFLLFSIY